MEIMVFGAGYVGLVTAAGLASTGNHVVVADTSAEKIQMLKNGKVPFFEPQLPELIDSGVKKGNLEFVQTQNPEFKKKLEDAEFYFLAVGTPEDDQGRTDLQYIDSVVDVISELSSDLRDKIVVVKSTVPVGTGDRIESKFKGKNKFPKVVSNPEFLKQGNAVQDFLRPARVVIGTEDEAAREILVFLYKAFMLKRDRIVTVGRRSAELVKYACNAFLATKISFINEISQLSEKVGADIREIREGMISDPRIGDQFLFPGLGYGGSCFPKDTISLIHQGEAAGMTMQLPRATREVNRLQKQWPLRRLEKSFGKELGKKKICLWGMAFKPNTDDLREAPSVEIVEALAKLGATVHAYDPVALERSRELFSNQVTGGQLKLFTSPYEAASGCDALVIVTEWQEFRTPNFKKLKGAMANPLIVDGRNIYDAAMVSRYGFDYFGVGQGQA